MCYCIRLLMILLCGILHVCFRTQGLFLFIAYQGHGLIKDMFRVVRNALYGGGLDVGICTLNSVTGKK